MYRWPGGNLKVLFSGSGVRENLIVRDSDTPRPNLLLQPYYIETTYSWFQKMESGEEEVRSSVFFYFRRTFDSATLN